MAHSSRRLEWGASTRPSICAGGFLEVAELIDLHLALGEHGFMPQASGFGVQLGSAGIVSTLPISSIMVV